MIRRDSSGKEYAEVEASAGERIRLTLVPAEEAGYCTTSLRIQIRQSDGKLRFGPEIPLTAMPEVLPGEDELAFVVRRRKAVDELWQR